MKTRQTGLFFATKLVLFCVFCPIWVLFADEAAEGKTAQEWLNALQSSTQIDAFDLVFKRKRSGQATETAQGQLRLGPEAHRRCFTLDTPKGEQIFITQDGKTILWDNPLAPHTFFFGSLDLFDLGTPYLFWEPSGPGTLTERSGLKTYCLSVQSPHKDSPVQKVTLYIEARHGYLKKAVYYDAHDAPLGSFQVLSIQKKPPYYPTRLQWSKNDEKIEIILGLRGALGVDAASWK